MTFSSQLENGLKEMPPARRSSRLKRGVFQPLVLSLFFIQARPLDTLNTTWFFIYPLLKQYGYNTIEECQDAITEMEDQDEIWDLSFEYRIKEEVAL